MFAIPNSLKKDLLDALITGGTTVKVAIMDSGYTPNIDSDHFLSDINAHEVSGAGYTAGGVTLANKTNNQDNTNDLAYFDGDDISLPGLTIVNGRYLAVYISTGNAATSKLLDIIDMGGNKSPTGDTFTSQWAAGGIFKIA